MTSLLFYQMRTVTAAVIKLRARSTDCAFGKIGSVTVYRTVVTAATKTIAVSYSMTLFVEVVE